MKIQPLLLLLLLLAALLPAQDMNPYLYLNHSSRAADGNLRLRWFDVTGNALGTECYYSADGAAWQSAPSEVYDASQMQALVPYSFGQNLRYRLRTELSSAGETIVYMHTPYLGTDSFPPQLNTLGFVGTDATGDSIMVYEPHLDFTDSWFASSGSKFYSALANVSGTFPTMNSLTSYNAYAAVVTNPEVIADSLIYAMIYTFNVVGVISPGLYKLTMGDAGIPDYVRIGNIQSQVSGGKLYLACDISDLTSDPDFGAWPNQSNALLVTALSLSLDVNLVNMDFEFGLGDYATPGFLFFQDHAYQVSQNTLPQYANFQISQANVVSFDYSDANGDFPLTAEFAVTGGETYSLLPQGYDYSQSVAYSGVLPSLPASGTLRISDNGIDFVEYFHETVAAPEETMPAPQLACRMANPLRIGEGPLAFQLSGLRKAPLSVGLYNLRGQKLASLFQGSASAEHLELQWDGNSAGGPLASGLYLLKVRQDGQSLVRRFILTN